MARRQHVSRDAEGGALISAVIAMVVVSLLIPGLLLLLHRSNRLATAQPDNDEGLQARAELAELFSSVDPISECASPEAGQDAAYRDRCFRERRWAGASLIEAPALPAANPAGHGACWLTSQEGGPRQRKCIVLEGDSDELQCSDIPSGPCLRVLSESDEADGEPVLVDLHGGGLLLVRSWDEDTTGGGVPFVPVQWQLDSEDRLIYHAVEWWCMRWRSPAPDGSGSVTPWTGDCPAPADPCERNPDDPNTPEREQWNPDWSAQPQVWTASTPCPQHTPALPAPAQAGPVDATGALLGPHTMADRITDVELLVCVASDYQARLQGAPHCKVDRMRFTVAGPRGWMPPVPGFALDGTVAQGGYDGLTVNEGSAGTALKVRLAIQPSHDVTVAVTNSTEVTVSAASLTFSVTDWNREQTITVTSADDADRDDETATVTLTATSTDTDYDGLTTSVIVTVTDDD